MTNKFQRGSDFARFCKNGVWNIWLRTLLWLAMLIPTNSGPNLLSVKSYKMSTIFCVRSHILSWKRKQQSKKPAFCLSWEGCKIMTKETVISFDSFHTKVISLLIDTWFQLGKNVINNNKNVINNKIADGLYELFTEHT